MGLSIVILINIVFVGICATPLILEKMRERQRARASILSRNKQCTNCAYNLTGLHDTATACPECGHEIPRKTDYRERLKQT